MALSWVAASKVIPAIGKIMKDSFDPLEEKLQEKIARDTLERYSGSPVGDFQPYVLLTNFSRYVHYFAESRGVKVVEGSTFKCAHSPKDNVSIIDFKIGSPAAALIVDLCAFTPIRSTLLLGMCGGLRRDYVIGEYFVPIASIRAEGTSDFYFPSEVPALANFLVQKIVTNVLEEDHTPYHIGITHTTNKRFWEFDQEFRNRLKLNRSQAIEMECATLFMASYSHRLPLGALLLISDLPLMGDGIKTKKSSEQIFANYTAEHVEKGIKVMSALDKALLKDAKGVYRGNRKRFKKSLPH